MSTDPTISIIIPSYNHAAYIGETIESLLSQSFGDFELIIVDDGSSDDSPALIKIYAEQDSRIIPIFQANMGPSAAVNRGLQIARGRFVTCHPSDDRSHSNRLEILFTYLNSHLECDLVGSYIEEIDGNGAIVSNAHKFESWFNLEKDFSDPKTWVWENRVASPTLMFRRDFFERYGNFDPDLIYTQDWEILIRSGSMGAKLQVLPFKLLQYRSHADNLTNKNTHEVFCEYAYISSKWLTAWLSSKELQEGLFLNFNGFIKHSIFKSFSNFERKNLVSLLAKGFVSSYPDFCMSLAKNEDDTFRILLEFFIRCVSERDAYLEELESQLSERNAYLEEVLKGKDWLESQWKAGQAELLEMQENIKRAEAQLCDQSARLEHLQRALPVRLMKKIGVISDV